MTEQIVQEWLADYASLTKEEVHSYASTLNENKEIINAVYAVLEDRLKYASLLDPVCNTLFDFYRSQEHELKTFTLIFLPTLIYAYLNAVAHGEKKSCKNIEVLLVGVYNLEAVDDELQAQKVSFRLPSLAQGSVYHEPYSLAPASFTERAIRRFEDCNTKLVRSGPVSQVEKILAQNRLIVMTALWFVYNQCISSIKKDYLDQMCKVTSKLVTQGFNYKPAKRVSYSSDVIPVLPRIPLSQRFLLEVLNSLYYSVYNGDSVLALQAVEEVHQRALYQGFSDVLIVSNAIKNSTHLTHAGPSSDAPMGISMALSPAPAAPATAMSKSMITNASFRTKKLPDDIPIPTTRSEGDSSGLGSITEEKEEGGVEGVGVVAGGGGGSGGGGRRSLPKMAVSLGKKTRERLRSKGKLVMNGSVGSVGSAGPEDDELGLGLGSLETDSGLGADGPASTELHRTSSIQESDSDHGSSENEANKGSLSSPMKPS